MKTTLKYILGFLFIAGMYSCMDVNDKFENLDEISAPPNDERMDYTLTDDDYSTIADLALDADENDTINAEFIEDNLYFTDEISSKKYIPAFIADLYPALRGNAAVKVTYNYYQDYPEILLQLSSPDEYELADADYAAVGEDQGKYKCFLGGDSPEKYIPGFLENVIGSPADGDIRLVKYKYAEAILDPSVTHKMVAADMQILVDHVSNDISTDYISSYGDSEYYYGASAYYQNFDARFSKRTEYNVEGFAGLTEAEANVLIAERIQEGIVYWLGVNYPDAVPTVDGDIVYYNISYDTYDGANHTFYVVYKCTASGATPTFELVDGPSESVLSYSSTVKENKGEYYQFDTDTWAKMEDVIYLGSGDYDAMGAPGKYDNFSSSVSPDDYLPTYLNSVYPYAQPGEAVTIAYYYYSGGSTNLKANEYVFDGGWTAYNPVVPATEQYVYVDGWMFDPTITITMATDDYQLIVDWVKDNIGADRLDSYGTAEDYYGAGAYYENFDGRAGKFDSSFETQEDAILEALRDVYLPISFPDAPTEVGGAKMYYVINYDTYTGVDGSGTMKFEVTKAGPDPEFALVEEE